MKKTLLFCICSLFTILILAQDTHKVDSLTGLLDNPKLSLDEQIMVYKRISSEYMDNDLDKLYENTLKGIELSRKKNDKAAEAWFTINIADCYNAWGKPDSALIFYKKTIELSVESGDMEQQANAYCSTGVFYYLRGQNITALDYYFKALAFSEKIENKWQMMIIYSNLGGIYRALMDTDRAVDYLEKCLKLAEEEDSDYGKMGAYYDLGQITMEKKEYGKSLDYINKTLELSKTMNDKQFEILGLQALAYLRSSGFKDHTKAAEYAEQSIQIAKKLGNKRFVRYGWVALSDIYLVARKYEESEAAAMEAWVMDSTNFNQARGIARNLAFTNALMGNHNKAAAFDIKFNEFNREYVKKSLHNTMADMEVKYETEKKEALIVSLEKEKELLIWLGVAAILLLMLLIGLLFSRYRLNVQKRKLAEQQLQQLEQEKQLIATQAELDGETSERARLARDLHDELGGLLSVVRLNMSEIKSQSSLGQRDVIRFSNASDILDKAIVEMRRIAHHMMPESLLQHGLRTSLEDFCRAIEGVNFQFYGDAQSLDDRLAVVLYRCTYELVANASKHANATLINVQFLIDDSLISLTVQDNGTGFDPETVKAGAGLNNIRKRISVYKGKLNIDSSPEKGTEITIEIENQ
ncbi:MAG: sensor histidine kinase [Prevotella sp.]|jgi:signal transduction histidine kinase|nr:sensor histidine kinase [Prevotella sp.]